MKKNILITGGAGYVGSKISHDLTDNGYKVFIIDNLSTGKKSLVNKSAIFFKADIGNKKKLNLIIKKNKIKIIIHLAASTIVEESMKNPSKYYINNIYNTKTLLDVCSKNNIKKIIFSSTCAVYGNIAKKRVKETDLKNPQNHYAITKLICEKLIKKYAKYFGFSYIILRYFNVVGADSKLRTGPTNETDHLFKNLSKNIIKKKYIAKVYGKNYKTYDGTCIRDYIDLNDLSLIHINILKNLRSSKSYVLNCGYGRGYSVLDVIKAFEKHEKKEILINFLSKRKGDTDKIIGNTNKIKKLKKINSNKFNLSDSVSSALNWERKIKITNKINL